MAYGVRKPCLPRITMDNNVEFPNTGPCTRKQEIKLEMAPAFSSKRNYELQCICMHPIRWLSELTRVLMHKYELWALESWPIMWINGRLSFPLFEYVSSKRSQANQTSRPPYAYFVSMMQYSKQVYWSTALMLQDLAQVDRSINSE